VTTCPHAEREDYHGRQTRSTLVGLVHRLKLSGHGGGGAQVSETLALSFAKFKEIYKPQSKTGTAESNVDWGFSINEHKEV